jgi:hypothetical protein
LGGIFRFTVIVRPDNDLEDPFARVGGIDSNDFTWKGTDGNAGPTDELDGGPTLELQSNRIVDFDEWRVDTTNGEFDRQVIGFGNNLEEEIALFDRSGSRLPTDRLDDSRAGAFDVKSIEFASFGVQVLQFFVRGIDLGVCSASRILYRANSVFSSRERCFTLISLIAFSAAA